MKVSPEKFRFDAQRQSASLDVMAVPLYMAAIGLVTLASAVWRYLDPDIRLTVMQHIKWARANIAIPEWYHGDLKDDPL
ncbi:hypothetical protein EOD23_28205 [Mesorhizobium sp. USDA-HM6]|nr:hypothetical protein EOD23_28205 [Mesorhizobium sp. USDA-HM6]